MRVEMGHTKIVVPNGLYGHKTEIKEKLRKCINNGYRDRHAPRWMHGRRGESIGDQLEEMVESAKRTARSDRSDKDWRSLGFSFSYTQETAMGTTTHLKGVTIGSSPQGPTAPESIQEKCRNYDLEDALSETDQWAPPERATFSGFEIEVKVGPRGGVREVQLVADYHH